ncbi:MAG: hypothetical protein HYY84_16285 [Deltaproteobacteria bacterium]|nr:hypothetical protein [Deltaproteobacteria bacterium]
MNTPGQITVQRQPHDHSIVPDGPTLHSQIAQASANMRSGLEQDSQESNRINHGGAQLPGTTATTGFSIPAATADDKALITKYNNILYAFEHDQITGDMLASNKALALRLEQALQWEQRFFQLMSNIAKLKHETMQGIIGNLRG